jgi:PilZ domain-containing protein
MCAPDQRRYPRAACSKNIVAAWQAGTHRGVSYLDNLSVGGRYVRTKEVLPVRCLVKLLLDLPVGQVRCRGVARRVRENHGIAIQIIAMEPTDRARLFQQVKSLLST